MRQQGYHVATRLNSVTLHKKTAEKQANDKIPGARCKDATPKTDVEDAYARLTANTPASCVARFPGGIERGRSVKDAVSSQMDGKSEEEGRDNATKCNRKYVKTVPFFHTVWRL